MEGALGTQRTYPFNWSKSLAYFGKELLTAFFLAGFFAICLAAMLKLLRKIPGSPSSVGELLRLALRAQSPYLLAGPAAIVIISLSQWVGAENVLRLGKLLASALPLAMLFILYALLKKRFSEFNELTIVALTLSPYLLLVGAVFAGLLSFFLLIAAILVIVLLT